MNRPQIEWIYNNVERMTNKYLAIFPLNDEQWKEFVPAEAYRMAEHLKGEEARG